ncbi:site-specific integrase [Mesorhizobium sp.]|uniref:site-specific integrase n=1 Tax=Mesorhizobium sp. TaxID=1871066 RepID=UPI00257D82D9|nr:site-specific integrase [Mesorhizobium sp.]
MVSFGAIIAEAMDEGKISRNPIRDLRRRRRRGTTAKRHEKKLKPGEDIPSPAEVKAIIEAAVEGKARMLIRTAAFTGLRASELRGLRWKDINFDKAELEVNQRADAVNRLGSPKSEAGNRKVPLPPGLVQELRKWKLKCPKKGDLGLVFPTEKGTPQLLGNILDRQYQPAVIEAGLTVRAKDKDGRYMRDDEGNPILKAKYPGLHCLRHFYASWCINRKVDGGLDLPAKMVQARLGHSTIGMTLNTYGHLFESGDDGSELAEAEAALLR